MPRGASSSLTPSFVIPMAARLVETLPEGDGWMYEVKFDGYRALLVTNGLNVHLRSRNNKDPNERRSEPSWRQRPACGRVRRSSTER